MPSDAGHASRPLGPRERAGGRRGLTSVGHSPGTWGRTKPPRSADFRFVADPAAGERVLDFELSGSRAYIALMELPDRVADLRQQVFDLAGVIGAPSSLLPTYVDSDDLARPHIEWEGDELHLVVRERGSEQERRKTSSVDEMLFWIFDGVASEMAWDWARRNQTAGQDFRIPWFRMRLELLSKLSRRWVDRFHEEHASLLQELGIT